MSGESLDEILMDDNHGYKEEVEYAGFWIRFGAAWIDGLIFLPIFGLGFYNQIEWKSLILLYVLSILGALYKPLMEWRYGATLGKMACRVKVVNSEFKPISIDQAFGRYIPWGISAIIQLLTATVIFSDPSFASAKSLAEIGVVSQNNPFNTISTVYSFVFLGLICWAAFDKKNQGVHDKIAKTFCVRVPKN